MKRKLFTNHISINASTDRIKHLLLDPRNLIYWDQEIKDVCYLTNNEFLILRKQIPMNSEETLLVNIVGEDVIEYNVKGIADYTVRWTFKSNALSNLEETLYINSSGTIRTISTLMSRIMQKEFLHNLYLLKRLCEESMS